MRALAVAVLSFAALRPPAFAADACSVHSATLAEPDAKTPELSTEEFRRIVAERRATVLDVRPRLEYEIGHVPGAVNVAQKPGTTTAQYVSDAAEIARLVGGKKDAPLVLYCNGPFCGKSKRAAADLAAAGFTNVRRYQLGMPVWRALGGVAQIEPEGARHVLKDDRTAVWLDARPAADSQRASVPGARRIPMDVAKGGKDNPAMQAAKNDGTLPTEDHNTRIVVFAASAADARAVADALAREAFDNVAFFGGSVADLQALAAAP